MGMGLVGFGGLRTFLRLLGELSVCVGSLHGSMIFMQPARLVMCDLEVCGRNCLINSPKVV